MDKRNFGSYCGAACVCVATASDAARDKPDRIALIIISQRRENRCTHKPPNQRESALDTPPSAHSCSSAAHIKRNRCKLPQSCWHLQGREAMSSRSFLRFLHTQSSINWPTWGRCEDTLLRSQAVVSMECRRPLGVMILILGM